MAASAAGGIWRSSRCTLGGTSASRWANTRNDARIAYVPMPASTIATQTSLTAPSPGSGASGVSSRGAPRSSSASAIAPGDDAGQRAEQHAEVAGARPRRPAARRRRRRSRPPPTGREVMAGTSSTRNTSGTAKSSGSESGSAEPDEDADDRAHLPVAPQHERGAEVVGELVVEPGRRRSAGGLVVGLLRPADDRHRVGLVGEQVADQQAPAQRHRRQVRARATRSRASAAG